MRERDTYETTTTAPKVQRLERLQTVEKEHKQALERANSLGIPNAVGSLDEEPSLGLNEGSSLGSKEEECSSVENGTANFQEKSENASICKSKATNGKTNWNKLVEKLLTRTESGKLQPKTDVREMDRGTLD